MNEGSQTRDDVFTKIVRAGRRTYFFDVKPTRMNDLYITITESKRVGEEGNYSYEKHKLFLYKEDFEKFIEGLDETIHKINELKASGQYQRDETPQEEPPRISEAEQPKEFENPGDVKFEDL